jgi:site-specific recombinase XerD
VCRFIVFDIIPPQKKTGTSFDVTMNIVEMIRQYRKRKMKLREAIELHISAMVGVKADATVAWYSEMLAYLERGLGANAELDRITIDDLREWRRGLVERNTKHRGGARNETIPGKLSPWTIYGAVKTCKSFFGWLVAEGVLTANPAKRLEVPRMPKPTRTGVADDVVDLFVQEAKSNPRDLALVLFIRDTGCRVAGAAGVKLSDLSVNSKDERLQRRVQVVEKGNKERYVFLKERSLKALKMWLEVRPNFARPGVDSVFVSISQDDRGMPLKPNAITQLFKRLAKKAGVEKSYSPHQWRHRYARKMI